jgi:chorismate mutase
MKQKNQDLAKKVLKSQRLKIDKLDSKILALLGERFGVVRQVADLKIKHDISGFIGERVEQVRNNAVTLARKYGIDEKFARTLYTLIIYESCATEDMIKLARRKKTTAKKKK